MIIIQNDLYYIYLSYTSSFSHLNSLFTLSLIIYSIFKHLLKIKRSSIIEGGITILSHKLLYNAKFHFSIEKTNLENKYSIQISKNIKSKRILKESINPVNIFIGTFLIQINQN